MAAEALAVLAGLGALAFVILLASLVIAGVVLYFGARWAGIEGVTVGKAILVALVGGIVSYLSSHQK